MKLSGINIRDPYILPHGGRYYLYGTRSATCWGPAEGFDCYVSADLEDWEGPFEIFRRPEGFWADESYWAPECYAYRDGFYLITTLGGGGRKKGVYALRADAPAGPFAPWGGELTPPDWTSIDGTLYFEGGDPWLVFSHSFEDVPTGDMCAVRLRGDLSGPAGEPALLFTAAEAPWARPVPFAKAEFGMDGDVYFTDGPALHKLESGALAMIWSSWSERGYAVGVALSPSGGLAGPWKQEAAPLFPENGGHGMLFTRLDGGMEYVLHYPNDRYQERPIRRALIETGGSLRLT